ncbi:MAG: uracil-DNA glycosylase [Candidatus Eremiobacteraeota bacterium]|nr:uracil-DNA glycosylase [Candidatus Eremiobacteraeota bacterium]
MASRDQLLDAVRSRTIRCARCPELRSYCSEVAARRKAEFSGERYWGRPLPSLGRADARLLIVGLAPAAHGGNRTGRMFTGDSSGNWLARALYRNGFATTPISRCAGDGFQLEGAVITAALRCAPPGNKPTRLQLARCAVHMRAELDLLADLRVAVGLGKVGFDALLQRLAERGYALARPRPRFAHGAEYGMVSSGSCHISVLACFHPSRQNTNTGKLSEAMLDAVFARAKEILDLEGASGGAGPRACATPPLRTSAERRG